MKENEKLHCVRKLDNLSYTTFLIVISDEVLINNSMFYIHLRHHLEKKI